MKAISVAVIGAGNRGDLYGEFARLHPEKVKIVAVAEPNNERREQFIMKHNIQIENIFHTYEELFEKDTLCDAVIVTTQDHDHFRPVMLALEKNYHVLVEKPMSPSPVECIEMVKKAKQTNKLLLLAYVLRYTPFFQEIKRLISDGSIGNVRHISIDMNVAYWHQAHSFVRGNWRSSTESSPMILAKSCHDFDIVHFLLDSPCIAISSFGSLVHFKKENAPIGSAERCLSGCEVEQSCPYSAKKIYLQDDIGWPVSTISSDLSLTGRKKVLETGPYGRCVYHCDNDVVDHQVVTMEFETQATATITMSGFTEKLQRQVRVLGTHGELAGEMSSNKITTKRFGKSEKTFHVKPSLFGMHAGGDFGLMENFWHTLSENSLKSTDSEDTIVSHLYAHAAEVSRLEGRTIDAREFVTKFPGGNRIRKAILK
ncbi:Gfo/Idh/MocA family oxidoreductase [Anaerobacillus sp. CMMVII]|uniref:Gfo/Idh/MocA family protein n=1 Tax=Anaerobacillus sp. CMMVII TaxID=2755588 RepID=UPI0021B7AE26|nr:Gfo/Idh/MocA family oxidoreductase [Anaerobacillus sp. CMMVII]MCT8139288.1 Gfo/Idh/MocA family oxidoreductase [Anaerobacillus sp. CMMVII]